MLKPLVFSVLLALAFPAAAQDHSAHDMDHEAHDHAEAAPDTGDAAPLAAPVAFAVTPDMAAALEAGGEPVAVDVLGVVCDFCAKAMNRTFGRRAEVAATYVDLDLKTLNFVFAPGATLPDEEITELVRKSGYRLRAIRRGDAVFEGGRVEIAAS